MLKTNTRTDAFEAAIRLKDFQRRKIGEEISDIRKQLNEEIKNSKLYLSLDEFKAQIKNGDNFESLTVIDDEGWTETIFADTVFRVHLGEDNFIELSDYNYIGQINLDSGEYTTYCYGCKEQHSPVIGIVDYELEEDN